MNMKRIKLKTAKKKLRLPDLSSPKSFLALIGISVIIYISVLSTIYYVPQVQIPSVSDISQTKSTNLNSLTKGISAVTWSRERTKQVMKIWDLADQVSAEEAAGMDAFGVYSLFPETYDCDRNYYKRIGGNDIDGGKWTCQEFFKPSENDCVAVSLGSFGQYEFEMSILNMTMGDCTVYTFDCTGTWEPPHPNIRQLPWCLGVDGIVDKRIYKSWHNITNDLGITHVDYFKIDIEGYEWVAMSSVLDDFAVLPNQIAIELHLWPQPPDVPDAYRVIHTSKGPDYLHPAINFFRKFYSLGYQIAATEYNRESKPKGCCQEFTFVRVGNVIM